MRMLWAVFLLAGSQGLLAAERNPALAASADELALFHGVKQAFDPLGLLNPGKAVPTLQRCAEFGAMHVHRGQEKFPELERF